MTTVYEELKCYGDLSNRTTSVSVSVPVRESEGELHPDAGVWRGILAPPSILYGPDGSLGSREDSGMIVFVCHGGGAVVLYG
jgi:hypothetical protein